MARSDGSQFLKARSFRALDKRKTNDRRHRQNAPKNLAPKQRIEFKMNRSCFETRAGKHIFPVIWNHNGYQQTESQK